MAGLERMKRFALICLALALLLSFVACVNYLPADGEGSGSASADATRESESVKASDTGESQPAKTTDDGDIPNRPEDGYTKFY